MPGGCNKILKFIQNHQLMKIPFVIYADTESLHEKTQACDNHQTELYISKINKHSVCGYLLFTHFSFDNNRSKQCRQT